MTPAIPGLCSRHHPDFERYLSIKAYGRREFINGVIFYHSLRNYSGMSRPHFWHQVGAHTCILASTPKYSPMLVKRTRLLPIRSWDPQLSPRFLRSSTSELSHRNPTVFPLTSPRNGSPDNLGAMAQRRVFSTAKTDDKDPTMASGLKSSAKETKVDHHHHNHDHSHSHPRSLFGHSHANGEDHSHSHGTEQIIAVLEGQGTRMAFSLPHMKS